jgi:hypothetical protein
VWYLTTYRISPAVDQDRFYLLQDLVMSGAVARFGFVRGVGASSMPDPRVNLGGDPYLTDGLRLVLFLETLDALSIKLNFSIGRPFTSRARARPAGNVAHPVPTACDG